MRFHLFLPLSIVFAALSWGAAAAPVTHGSCRASGDPRLFKDDALTMKVTAKLQFNKALMREKIDVKSNHGIITLAGHVVSRNLIAVAGRDASQVEGVVCVNNLLRVGPRDMPMLPGSSR